MSNNKIGVAVTTYNRPDYFKNCIDSIPAVDTIVVVNDGTPYSKDVYPSKVKEVVQHDRNLGIACAKNSAMRTLMQDGCDWLFVIEDDVFIKDPTVFEKYINAANKSGIYHMNFGFSNMYNFNNKGEMVIRETIEYAPNTSVIFTYNVVAGFSMYLRGVIKHVGYMDERYTRFNNMEHVDHTMSIIQAGLHPPFWWFADIDKSWESIGVIKESFDNSTVRKDPSFKDKFQLACQLFKHKWSKYPTDVPQTTKDDVLVSLERIKTNYARE